MLALAASPLWPNALPETGPSSYARPMAVARSGSEDSGLRQLAVGMRPQLLRFIVAECPVKNGKLRDVANQRGEIVTTGGQAKFRLGKLAMNSHPPSISCPQWPT